MKRTTCLLLVAALAAGPSAWARHDDARPLLVFAAASLADALHDVGDAYTAATGQRVTFSFASSGMLARQLEAGAEADVFLSADAEWMDYVEARHLIEPGTRVDLLTNRLVLIAPADAGLKPFELRPGADLDAALGGGRLAIGDPRSVPAGKYALAALTHLDIWPRVADRVVRADNVRGALAFVARGEAPLGIVYASDALAEGAVEVVATFPPSAYPPIVYPLAITPTGRGTSERFAGYLRGAEARAMFERWGFGSASMTTEEGAR